MSIPFSKSSSQGEAYAAAAIRGYDNPPGTTPVPDPNPTPAAQAQPPSPSTATVPTTPTILDSVTTVTAHVISDKSDTRIRLRAQRGAEKQVYGDPADKTNILNLLNSTDGLLFPYTPTIAVGQQINYSDVELVHSNGDIMTYKNTPSVTLNVTGKFTVQNQREGQYALAVLHFLRTVSKMYFGETDKRNGKAGLPPPVLVFRGYGNYMFNNLPVILKSHSYTFDEGMDMIEIEIGSDTNNNNLPSGIALLPAMFQVSMDLVVQQTPAAMRKIFSLDDFRTGALLKSTSGTGWI